MTPKSRTAAILAATAVLVFVNLILFNALVGSRRIFRADFTEGRLFTLTGPTLDLIRNLEEPAELHFYYSEPSRQHELLRPLIRPLADLLLEIQTASRGRVQARLHEISEATKGVAEAAGDAYGVRPLPLEVSGVFESSLRNTYFALVVVYGTAFETYSLDQRFDQLLRVELLPGDSRGVLVELADIEATVTRALRKLSQGFGSIPGALVLRDKTAKVTVFLSDKAALPKDLEGLEEAVRKVTEKIDRESGGRLPTGIVDPLHGIPEGEVSAVVERLFREQRIRPFPRDLFGEKVYYASALVELDGKREPVALFEPGQAPSQADVTASIEGALRRLLPGYLPEVGVATPEPPFDPMMMQMRRPPQSEFAYLTRTLENDFSVRSVSFGSGRSIPASAETLLLIRPKEQSDQVLYELDQFLMRGGRLVVCADHFSLDAQQSEMTGSIRLSTTSNPKLAEFLAHFGIRVAAEMLADSRSEYLPVPGRVRYVAGMPVREYVNVAYPYFLRLPREAFSTDDQLTAGRAGNALLWACPVELADPLPEGVTGRVLARTSPQAWTTTSSADVESILEGGFAPPAGSRSYGVAAVVRGRFRSYFAERPLPGLEKPEGDGGAPAEGAPERTEAKGGFLTEAARPSEIVVIGDSDWLSPAVLQTFRQSDSVLNENLRWLITLLERADATDAAVAARSRAPASRPLTGLSGLAPEERDARGRRAFLLVTLASLGLLGAVGLAWAVHRARQQPMTLAPPESQP